MNLNNIWLKDPEHIFNSMAYPLPSFLLFVAWVSVFLLQLALHSHPERKKATSLKHLEFPGFLKCTYFSNWGLKSCFKFYLKLILLFSTSHVKKNTRVSEEPSHSWTHLHIRCITVGATSDPSRRTKNKNWGFIREEVGETMFWQFVCWNSWWLQLKNKKYIK